MNKRIVSIVLCLFLLVGLIACSSTNSVGNTKISKINSKLAGEYIFYIKDDKTYFSDNDKIKNELLVDREIDEIKIDSKRNNLILVRYLDGNKDYQYMRIKSLKNLEAPMVEFDDATILNNKYIIYSEYSSGLFVYDLDSNKKERIKEYEQYENSIDYIIKGDKVLFFSNHDYFSGNKSDIYEIGYYDLKTKQTEITIFNKSDYTLTSSNVALNYPITYFVDEPRIEGGISKLYYYDFNTKNLTLIDEMNQIPISTRGKYTVYSGISLIEKNVGNTQNDEGVFYWKTHDFDNYDPINTYYYTKLDNIINFDSGLILGTPDNSYTSKYPIVNISERGIASLSGFYIKDKKFNDARIIGVSKEGNYILYRDSNKNCYKMDIDTFEIRDLNDSFDSYDIKYFDKDSILYVNKNKDLKYNGNLIDYSVDSNTIDYSNDFKTMCYETNDGLTLFKDNNSVLIENDAKNGYLTNKGNVYYRLNNDLVFYKDGEKQIIDSSNEWYGIKPLGYKIID